MKEVCSKCDLGLKPVDCSSHEILECEFVDVLWRYVESFGVQNVIETLESKIDNYEKKKAIKYLLDKLN